MASEPARLPEALEQQLDVVWKKIYHEHTYRDDVKFILRELVRAGLAAGRQEMQGAVTTRYEMSQHLIRKALEMDGCCGLHAQVDESTCLIVYPDNPHEWCPPCLMAGAAELLVSATPTKQEPEK